MAWLHSHLCYWTGGTKYILAVARQLNKEYSTTLFVENYDEKIRAEFEKNGIRIVKTAPVSSNRILYWLFFPIILLWEIAFLRRRLPKYEKIISSMFPMNIIANTISRERHIQFIFEPYAFFHDKNMINGYPLVVRLLLKLLKFLYGWIDIKYTKMSRELVTVNSGVSKWVKKIYGREAHPAYLIIDTTIFKPTINDKIQKKYYGRKVVLHTTDFTPLKNTAFIVKAFKQVVQQVPSALLLITSPRDVPQRRNEMMETAIKLGIKNNIEFTGFIPNEDLPAYYSLADCAVYPGIGSGASACSYFVLEVMACETPVVRTSDSKEEVIDGKSGFLFSPTDKDNMVKGILRFLRDERLARKFGGSARKRVLAIYNAENVGKNFNSVLKSVKYRE